MMNSAAVVNPRNRQLTPWLAYPLVMAAGFFLYTSTISLGISIQIASYIAALFAALAITALEYSCPHLNTWHPDQQNVRADLMFMISVQVALPTLLAVTLSAAAVGAINETGWLLPSLWPHEAPVWAQVILMLLVADFLRYWLHVAAHVYKPLWRLHAVHHSVDKLYWLNVGRFHPVEKTLQYLFDALPFVLMQVSPDVLGAYFVFYSINGFFQHSNVEVRFGWLNYIISSAELHRWHHSRITEESNSNYGNNLIVWDVIFGTRFLPEDRDINELGLVNTNYPAGFSEQMRTPCIAGLDKVDAPLPGWRALILNTMIWLRMKRLRLTVWRPFVAVADQPEETQNKLLQQILKTNETTEFGREHSFADIKTYENYKQNVAVQDYESLRPYIDRQIAGQSEQLTSVAPIMFSRTSGTTGQAKLIPILPASLESHKHAQKLFSVAQFEAEPSAYYGSVLGIVSPAFEGTLENGMKYGSTSGHVYKNMPGPTRAKYVIPWQVFEIADYDLKYLVILRLALAREDITHLASANPSTFLRLVELARENRQQLIVDIKNQSFSRADELPVPIREAVEKRLAVSPERSAELEQVLGTEDFLLKDIWPYLRMVTTWTGGSCAIAMAALRKQLPTAITVADPGYIASEFRGTITVDVPRNLGCPAITENFYEFVEREAWENGENNFIRLHELEEGHDYYVFTTTQTGLYRYFINDIVKVNGRFGQTPTLQFVQKGKGTTNITGEKLTESQVLAAVQNGAAQQEGDLRFFVMLADAEKSRYRLLLESIGQIDIDKLSEAIESSLSEQNIEYREKRNSGRLEALLVHTMRNGFYEAYKKSQLEAGQREGQFKTLALQNQAEFGFDWKQWSL